VERKRYVEPTIGQRLKEYREHRGMTVRELAEAAHVSPGAISHYENGRMRIPSERLREISLILAIKSDDLLQPPGSPLRRNRIRLRVFELMAAMFAKAAAIVVPQRAESRRNADEEAIRVAALSTAIAIAASAAAHAGERESLTISGDDSAVDISGSGAASEFNPIGRYKMAATVTDTVVADKLEMTGTASQAGMLKIDPAILQLDDVTNALIMADATSTETINLSPDYIMAWNSLNDDGGGDKIDPPASAAGETSMQSIAENGFSASNPFTETPNGNENHSAFNFDNFKFADDSSIHPGKTSVSAQHSDKSSPAVADKDHPAHPHSDNFKFADDDSAHLGNVKGKDKDISAQSSGVSEDQFKTKLDDHHASADPKIDDIAKGHSPQHTPAQHDDNGSPAVIDKAHPVHPHSDNFKFADDDSAHPGHANDGKDASAQSTPADTVSDAASDQFIFGKGFVHETIADKSDMTETDHTVADIQHLLHSAHDTNAVNAHDMDHTTGPQDMTKVHLPQHHGDFHFG
jgi:transcriptional regulator with XRE-family HTH domain